VGGRGTVFRSQRAPEVKCRLQNHYQTFNPLPICQVAFGDTLQAVVTILGYQTEMSGRHFGEIEGPLVVASDIRLEFGHFGFEPQHRSAHRTGAGMIPDRAPQRTHPAKHEHHIIVGRHVDLLRNTINSRSGPGCQGVIAEQNRCQSEGPDSSGSLTITSSSSQGDQLDPSVGGSAAIGGLDCPGQSRRRRQGHHQAGRPARLKLGFGITSHPGRIGHSHIHPPAGNPRNVKPSIGTGGCLDVPLGIRRSGMRMNANRDPTGAQ